MAALKEKLVKCWKSLFGKNVWAILVGIAFLLMLANLFVDRRGDFSDYATRHFDKVLNKRFAQLEDYMQEALDQSPGGWLKLKDVPEDMVIYRYYSDSLQSWVNQFSLDNDDISHKLVVQRFGNLRYNFVSPLVEADTTVKYLSIGPKWYLVKSLTDRNGCRVIGGLEVRNTLDTRSVNGVNPKFRLSDRFSLHPISTSGGSVISVNGYPLMKLIQEATRIAPILPDTTLLWFSAAFFVIGVLTFLYFNRSLRSMWFSILSITVAMLAFYIVGYGMQSSDTLFSPTLYADGPILYSLGAVLIINIWLVLVFACLYIAESPVREFMKSSLAHKRLTIAFVLLSDILVIAYTAVTFRSLILNSNISLELYKIVQLGRFSLYIYLSYLALVSTVPLSLQIIRIAVFNDTGLKYDVFSRTGRSVFAIFSAVFFLLMFSLLGTQKETNRVQIWLNRLSIDRDLGLELQLRGMENAIAADNSIPEVMAATNDYKIILNRITETYMNRISKDFDISVYLFKENISDPQVAKYFNERVVNAVPIAPESRFVYSRTANGMAQYTGMFVYYSPKNGTTKMLLGVNSKSDKNERGYAFVLDSSSPGAVVIPPQYSFAKYIDGKLVSYKGDYPYPTVLNGKFRTHDVEDVSERLSVDAYVHFYSHLYPDESIVISRPRIGASQYALAACMLWLAAYSWISLIGWRRKKYGNFEKNYYKSRVNTVLFLSMLMTLVTMSTIMVFFVYKRNDANVMRLMTSKITTIQSLMANRVRYCSSYSDVASQDMASIMDDIGNYTRSDITLYTPGGRVFNTTAPEVYEKMLLGSRTNPEAYRNIMYSNKRFYIHRESIGGRNFYTMYAPIFNDKGKILAILSAPYTDSGLSFKQDAVFHSVFVMTVFFILLIITRFLTTKVVDKMFRPIVEMGRKMIYARTGGLEYIIYDKEDEISSLVRAYNLMVHDLSESSKQVAQAERERAWSEMARQVAHEIKNPLTPMKLQIQRLIRLKSKNDPTWETKFEDISRLILDSIEVLTDTANEFSTFAKLYTEEMVPINLDDMASDQISMFDDKENISFGYFGLKDAWVTGPKPQLIRVFVNLLTNAVQAIENQQTEDKEAGREPEVGHIVLSLRNSSKEGFYDIVLEDNGPGIKDENRSRLFTPNFTTKSGGTGLGLAICKNILERCGGEIFYSKSFVLGGACFTVRFPKGKR